MPRRERSWHLEFNTFGTWLPGDPRGFRSHDHRIHSSGDYRNPPPPIEHQALHVSVQSRLHKAPVVLNESQRASAGQELRRSLESQDCVVHVIAVVSNHAHLLVRTDMDEAGLRKVAGNAKRKSSHSLRDSVPGALWQRPIGLFPVHGARHFENVLRYIRDHEQQGGWVWVRSAAED